MTDSAKTPHDLTDQSKALRADARALVDKTRDFAAEIWSDFGQLTKDGYRLAVDWGMTKRGASDAETPSNAAAPSPEATENSPEAAPSPEAPEAAAPSTENSPAHA